MSSFLAVGRGEEARLQVSFPVSILTHKHLGLGMRLVHKHECASMSQLSTILQSMQSTELWGSQSSPAYLLTWLHPYDRYGVVEDLRQLLNQYSSVGGGVRGGFR